jgi:ubiquinone/menaquinone biosynthesis C-methylase UbiE
MSSSQTPKSQIDFGQIASRYDELRHAGALWSDLVELLVAEADLRGRRVLDVGCGTGKLITTLVERYGCKAWGIDPSPEMIEIARERVPSGVGLRGGRAEELGFKDAWFERVVMTLVLHVVDRPKAYAEILRVLEPAGVFGLLTFDYAHFEGYYLNRYFPSFEAIDKARFPSAVQLEGELGKAGFVRVRLIRRRQHESISRDTALKRIRGKHISTFQLISDDEYRTGLERAESELPERIDYTLEWLVAVGEC